jgi:hypothetical protein
MRLMLLLFAQAYKEKEKEKRETFKEREVLQISRNPALHGHSENGRLQVCEWRNVGWFWCTGIQREEELMMKRSLLLLLLEDALWYKEAK